MISSLVFFLVHCLFFADFFFFMIIITMQRLEPPRRWLTPHSGATIALASLQASGPSHHTKLRVVADTAQGSLSSVLGGLSSQFVQTATYSAKSPHFHTTITNQHNTLEKRKRFLFIYLFTYFTTNSSILLEICCVSESTIS